MGHFGGMAELGIFLFGMINPGIMNLIRTYMIIFAISVISATKNLPQRGINCNAYIYISEGKKIGIIDLKKVTSVRKNCIMAIK